MAGFARFFHNLAPAFATRAGLRDAENPSRGNDLSASIAGVAGFNAGTFLGPLTVANIAAIKFVDGDFSLDAAGGFEKRNFHVVTQIGTALGAIGIAAFTAKQVFK